MDENKPHRYPLNVKIKQRRFRKKISQTRSGSCARRKYHSRVQLGSTIFLIYTPTNRLRLFILLSFSFFVITNKCVTKTNKIMHIID